MRRHVVWCIAMLGAVGCGRSKPDFADRVADAIPRLERSTGLKFKTQPKFEARSREDVARFLEERFAADLPDAEVRGVERTYKRLGLVPDSMDLRKFMLALLTEQVAGYYDPAKKVLYIVQGASDEMVGITVSHELVHALQDQYFNLDSLQHVVGENDRQVAAQSVMEGQAMLEQLATTTGGADVLSNFPGGWDRIREVIRDSQGSMPIFAGAPTIIQETMLFPYLSGAEFMKNFKERRPGDTPYGDMPVSTEQILHADRFFTARDIPTAVTLPSVAGAKEVYQNVFGEFETRLFLFQHLKDRDAAFRGAAGWDGDRFASFSTARGDGIVWASVWDTSIDAAEFYDLFDTALLKRFESLKPSQASENRRVYTANGRTMMLATMDIGGRPVVIFVDVPNGTSPDVFDFRKIVLQEG